MSEPEKEKPVCPNCGQWQHPHKGKEHEYYDCLHECVKRGFAPLVKVDV